MTGSDPTGRSARSRLDIRPLDRIPSIRTKFALIIALAVAVTAAVSQVAAFFEIRRLFVAAVAVLIALVTVRLFARGMTSPLREMEEAAAAIARGDYDRRVTTASRDEVGRLAAEFNIMAAQLAEVDRLRRDLVANVSHELRTPISALQANLENLVDGVQPPDPVLLRTMLAQTERLGRLVGQLLDLSRLESGTSPLHPEIVALGPLLAQAAAECRLHPRSPVVDVITDPPGLSIHGDAERLHQVVANLLENAVRHSPRREAVELRAHRVPGAVLIEVSDRGPGIPADERPRVFERFHRSDSARAVDDGGAGLGLSIARWIVELHGGTIRADERPDGPGCRMEIILPDTRPANPDAAPNPLGL
jgi:signal transduction histidine kinase